MRRINMLSRSYNMLTPSLLASSLLLGGCSAGPSSPNIALPSDTRLPPPEGPIFDDQPIDASMQTTETDRTAADSTGGTSSRPSKPDASGPLSPSTPVSPSTPAPSTPPECPAPTWANVPALPVQATHPNVRSMQATINGTCLSVLIEVGSHDGAYGLLIDSDSNAATGYQAWNWSEHAGAEYLVQGGRLQRYDPSDPAMPWKWRDPTPLPVLTTSHSLEFRIPLSALQLGTVGAAPWIGFMLVDSKGNPTGQIPSGASFAQLGQKAPVASSGPDRSACKNYTPSAAPAARAKFSVSKGMIVPATGPVDEIRDEMWALLATYDWPKPFDLHGEKQVQPSGARPVPLYDQEFAWLSLIREARKMRAAGLDFWVVVSSPGNASREAWQRVGRFWDDLRKQGGRVFGHVRTCSRPGELPELRGLDDVAKQVDGWMTNYPALDGFWLDDFNPRYELFDVEHAAVTKHVVPPGCDAGLMPPSFPNGVCAAPIDRSFLRQDGCYDPGVQIQPAGGYYHTLTSRIRGEYPWLRIVGNAGGNLYSNQLKYADLVDVLVSYRQSFSDWSRLKAQTPTPAALEAALLYGTSQADMPNMLGYALDHKFSHVYATDRTPTGGADAGGELSSYLEAEVDYLIERL